MQLFWQAIIAISNKVNGFCEMYPYVTYCKVGSQTRQILSIEYLLDIYYSITETISIRHIGMIDELLLFFVIRG